MSYIPPHKRHSKDPAKPSPVPDSIVTKFKKQLDFTSTSYKDSVSKWFIFGSNGIEDEVPSYVKLVPLTSDSVERRNGEKPMVLMNNNVQSVNMNIGESEEERTQWLLVAEKVEEDLVLAYKRAKTEMEEHHHVLRLAASFGKNFFYRRQGCPVGECSPKNSNKMFSPDIPTYYLQHIKSKVVPSHKFCIDEEKETYIVNVDHYTCPNATISCICTMTEDGRLSMYKAERNPVRHLVVDVSCIDKNIDMRLMLATKRKIIAFTEIEKCNIKELLDSVTIDPNGKGRLRWQLGKTVSEGGYRIFEVCHVRATIYKNRTLRLKVRETYRFNERSGTGEIKRGVTFILQDMDTKLQQEQDIKVCVTEMLRDALGTIWDFLHCDAYLT